MLETILFEKRLRCIGASGGSRTPVFGLEIQGNGRYTTLAQSLDYQKLTELVRKPQSRTYNNLYADGGI